LNGFEKRRQYSVEEKLRVLSEARVPGACVSAVARRHGLRPSQVFKWRRLAALGVIGVPGASELPSFVAIEVAASEGEGFEAAPVSASAVLETPRESVDAPPVRTGLIEIDLGCGRRVRVDRDVDLGALRRVLDALGER
jgi:transposase